MDESLNPYVPGAGTRPPLLAGRDDLVSAATLALARSKNGLHGKSFIAVGLRGVGKTVVLNRVHELAEDSGYYVLYMEANDQSSLATMIVPKLRSSLLKMSRVSAAVDMTWKALQVLKNFASALRVTMGDIEFGLDLRDDVGTADSGDITNDLPELLQVAGMAAQQQRSALAIIIDEMQYLSPEEMGALVMALHRTSQRGLPVVLFGAGLPQVVAKMGESKSYAERLFEFPRVRELSFEHAKLAVTEPAKSNGVVFTESAMNAIYTVTEGYPYFLQEWGYVSWNIASNNKITGENISDAGPEAVRRLDESFFRMRLERMTPTERRYIAAMASLGRGPHASGDIAKAYKAKVSTVAPLRSALIAKGMIYSPSYGNTDFTVPLFDGFIRREFAAAGGFE